MKKLIKIPKIIYIIFIFYGFVYFVSNNTEQQKLNMNSINRSKSVDNALKGSAIVSPISLGTTIYCAKQNSDQKKEIDSLKGQIQRKEVDSPISKGSNEWENKCSLLNGKYNSLEITLKNKEEEIREISKELQKQKQTTNKYNFDKQLLENQEKEIKQLKEQLKQKNNFNSSTKFGSSFNSTFENTMNQSNVETMQKENDQLKEEIRRLESKSKNLEQKINSSKTTKEQVSQKEKDLQKKLDEKEQENKEIKKQIEDLQEKEKKKVDIHVNVEKKIEELKQKYENMKKEMVLDKGKFLVSKLENEKEYFSMFDTLLYKQLEEQSTNAEKLLNELPNYKDKKQNIQKQLYDEIKKFFDNIKELYGAEKESTVCKYIETIINLGHKENKENQQFWEWILDSLKGFLIKFTRFTQQVESITKQAECNLNKLLYFDDFVYSGNSCYSNSKINHHSKKCKINQYLIATTNYIQENFLDTSYNKSENATNKTINLKNEVFMIARELLSQQQKAIQQKNDNSEEDIE